MNFTPLSHRLKRKLCAAGIIPVLALAVLCCSSSSDKGSAKSQPPAIKKDSITEVSLLFAGDVMMHVPELDAARIDSTDGYNFTSFFQYVSPVIQKADIAVANLETTFGGKPYSGYPQFSSPDTLAWFLKRAGFDLMVTANNHAADRGTRGINGTLNGLDRAGLAHTGTFSDSLERAKKYPFIIDKKGIKIAFLNYTYGTNGLVVHAPVIVNYIDTIQIKKDILAARQKKADAIIIVFHWGIEYQRFPNEEQKKIARYCLANGIDIVIGSHPHVVQPAIWETYRKAGDTIDRKGLVLYSLGNYVSNQRQKYTDGGIMFSFTLRKNKLKKTTAVVNPEFLPTWVYPSPAPRKFYILPANQFQNDSTFVKPAELRTKMRESFDSNRNHMLRDSVKWLREMK
jgi:2',3'-cyclic-nucleotide 2'-phosphodiesterase (5'-nucleotidase family)